jgi:hypothetical protein
MGTSGGSKTKTPKQTAAEKAAENTTLELIMGMVKNPDADPNKLLTNYLDTLEEAETLYRDMIDTQIDPRIGPIAEQLGLDMDASKQRITELSDSLDMPLDDFNNAVEAYSTNIKRLEPISERYRVDYRNEMDKIMATPGVGLSFGGNKITNTAGQQVTLKPLKTMATMGTLAGEKLTNSDASVKNQSELYGKDLTARESLLDRTLATRTTQLGAAKDQADIGLSRAQQSLALQEPALNAAWLTPEKLTGLAAAANAANPAMKLFQLLYGSRMGAASTTTTDPDLVSPILNGAATIIGAKVGAGA